MSTVAATTIREGNRDNLIEKVRAEIFLDTAKELAMRGIACKAVYVDCSDEYCEKVRNLGVTLIAESRNGMGHTRRQALRACYESGAEYCFWLEPEKSDMPRFVKSMIKHMRKKQASLGLFARKSLKSYPREQALYYTFCRSVASRLIGRDIDYGFGPMVIARNALPYFLNYDGSYGDMWDSILIPRLRIMRNETVEVLHVDFVNDDRMMRIEDGHEETILKRVAQLGNVVPALIEEWHKLTV